MPSKVKDQYVNLVTQRVVLSAPNTLTFQRINFGTNLFDKYGLVIHRLEYDVGRTTMDELVADTDVLQMGLCTSDELTAVQIEDPDCIDACNILAVADGVAANFTLIQLPISRDFCDFPGKGIIVSPSGIYFGVDSAGFVGVADCVIRVYFTLVALKDSEFIELLQTRRGFS